MNETVKIFDPFFMEIARPIIEHEKYREMKDIRHHNGSVFDHCVDVAYFAYNLGKKYKLDCSSLIRGALLHDFYLYKFRKREDKNILSEGFRHSKMHPKIALKNAEMYFELNDTERDIISHHMFPIGWPRSKEAWVTTLADKYWASIEYLARARNFAFLQGCQMIIVLPY